MEGQDLQAYDSTIRGQGKCAFCGAMSRSVSGVTKVRYGDRPDFRTLEWGVPVCKVASIQIGRGFNLCVAPF